MTLEDDYAAAVEAAVLYEATWWMEPGSTAERRLAAVPGLAGHLRIRAEGGHMVSTVDVFKDPSAWDVERQGVHERVLARLGSVSKTAGSAAHVYLVLGSPGSGKTRVLREAALSHARRTAPHSEAHVSDADEVRASLPEYAGGLGSSVLQDEVVVLAYGASGYPTGGGLQQRVLAAAPGSAVLVVDVVGDPERTPALVVRMASKGWSVFALLAECPIETCVQRVMRRALDTGRIVSPAYVRTTEGRPQQALQASIATGALAGWAAVDTSGPVGSARVIRSDATAAFGAVGDALAA